MAAALADAQAAGRRLARGRGAGARTLHELRVALRRWRSLERAWRGLPGAPSGNRERRAVKRLLRGTGDVRDAQVALAWLKGPGARGPGARAARHLARELRQSARQGLRQARALVAEHLEPLGRQAAQGSPALRGPKAGTGGAPRVDALVRKVAQHVRRLERRLDRVRSARDRRQAHAARIAAKRLRYLVEPVAPWVAPARRLVAELKRLQDLLGELNDAHVLQARIAVRAGGEPGARGPGPRTWAALGRRARARVRGAYRALGAHLGAAGRTRLGRRAAALAQALAAGLAEARPRAGAGRTRGPLRRARRGTPRSSPHGAREGAHGARSAVRGAARPGP